MPVTILDLILLGVMLISGLLAMVRGFMREILSIAAWGTAAIVTLYSFSKLLPTAKTYFNNDTVASVVVVAGVFVGTLVVVSVITVRISDMILDSRIGALDRTLGFLFGLARGLLIVVVAFPVLHLARAGQAAPGLGHGGQIPRGAAGNRGLADGPLA
ncbi:putative membrane protein required for colicin V production [Bradyrhizobium sp. GM2.4]